MIMYHQLSKVGYNGTNLLINGKQWWDYQIKNYKKTLVEANEAGNVAGVERYCSIMNLY